ncbi:hypothetical protein LCGC14_0851920 [marine sediment metagenome]|uniref:Uncharacterized protein n=1 Tax=marine sediment metagenome TaxID=412755 RepID=A0A0F9P9Y9_9ZZZZ
MAPGDYTLTDHGTFSISSIELKNAVDGVNITDVQFISGGRLHLVPAGEGQISVLEVEVSG